MGVPAEIGCEDSEATAVLIFISYRREDKSAIAGRIDERLREHFGKRAVFRDVNSIPLGQDFRQAISDAVRSCDIFLAVVGPEYLGDRIRASTDPVRLEIEEALARDKCMIPVLLDGTALPDSSTLPESVAPIVYRNGVRFDVDRRFEDDIRFLVASIERARSGSFANRGPLTKSSFLPRWPHFLAPLLLLASVGLVVLVSKKGPAAPQRPVGSDVMSDSGWPEAGLEMRDGHRIENHSPVEESGPPPRTAPETDKTSTVTSARKPPKSPTNVGVHDWVKLAWESYEKSDFQNARWYAQQAPVRNSSRAEARQILALCSCNLGEVASACKAWIRLGKPEIVRQTCQVKGINLEAECGKSFGPSSTRGAR